MNGPKPDLKRVAYSPGEFAELFGKSQTWGYRQIYGGKVNTITAHGRILIPAKEVERILESAGIYNGMDKPARAKQRVEQLSPEQKSIWQRFILSRSNPPSPLTGGPHGNPAGVHSSSKWQNVSRKSDLGKFAKFWAGALRREK